MSFDFDLAQQLALVAFGAPQRALEHFVAIRVEGLEAEVFELELDRIHAEPVRDRRVDVERLARDAPLLLDGQRLDRPHVVRPIRELDEDDAQILRHREQHLAEALGLRLGRAVEAQMVDLADAVDEQRDVVAEPLLDLGQRARRVLDDVVQQRRLDRAGVEVQPGQYFGYGDRMGDVGIAVAPLLALVSLGAELVGRTDARQVVARQVALELPHEPAEVVRPPHRRHDAIERGGTIVHGG